MPNTTEVAAIQYVSRWAKRRGIKVIGVSHEGVGYDYKFVYPNGRIEKVEVKGSEAEHKIPDMRTSEFRDKRLKADYILLVGNASLVGKRALYKIPRGAIKPGNLKLLKTYHIRRFQGKANMAKYRIN